MTTMKPCPKCHSTEHLRIEINDDRSNGTPSAEVSCTECRTFAQIDYVPTRQCADECRPSDIQLTREVIERWNELCDDWEGIFDHE
jgi:hypothetical protein